MTERLPGSRTSSSFVTTTAHTGPSIAGTPIDVIALLMIDRDHCRDTMKWHARAH